MSAFRGRPKQSSLQALLSGPHFPRAGFNKKAGMTQVFIDGSSGTTGLRIRERLEGRQELTLITLPEESRKDPEARRNALNSADVAILCLPDAAA